MVRSRLLAAFLLTAPATALASAPETALKSYEGTGYAAYPLTHPRLSDEGRLVVQAESQFLTQLRDRKGWVEEACANWVRAITSTGSTADPGMLILTPDGGELWECDVGRATQVETWGDTQIPLTGPDFQIGNLFMSFSGQATLSSPATYGFNFAEGLVSYKRKLDLLANVGLISTNTTMMIGLVVRYRAPITSAFGLTVGGQPGFQMSILKTPDPSTGIDTLSVATAFTFAFLGGVYVNVPTGTIDLTGSVDTNGTYSVLLGHTFFFNVR